MMGVKNKFVAANTHSSALSILAQDVTITGNLISSGDVHIDGAIEGDITCTSLSVGAPGRIKGHIKAESARLAGQFEGTLDVRELNVEASARISGELSYESVSIAAGAHIDGRVNHRAPATQTIPLVSHTID